VVHTYRTELRIRYHAGIRTQAKHGCVLRRQRLSECGAVREASMKDLFQLGVRDTELPAPNSGHTPDSAMVQARNEGRGRQPFQSRPRAKHVSALRQERLVSNHQEAVSKGTRLLGLHPTPVRCLKRSFESPFNIWYQVDFRGNSSHAFI
jgi:hypothetical protein